MLGRIPVVQIGQPMRPVTAQISAANFLTCSSSKAPPVIRQAKVEKIAEAIRPCNISPEPGAILRGQVSPTVIEMNTVSATGKTSGSAILSRKLAGSVGVRERCCEGSVLSMKRSCAIRCENLMTRPHGSIRIFIFDQCRVCPSLGHSSFHD